MDSGEPRYLLNGWCTEGEPWSTISESVDPEEWERIRTTFDPKKAAEVTAALLTYAYTGLTPSNQDDQGGQGDGRNGAVDIVLTDIATGEQQVMEVTTSLDRRYQDSSASLTKFEDAVTSAYRGNRSWSLELQRDWEGMRLVRDLAPAVATALSAIADSGEAIEGPIALHSHVIAWPNDTPGQPGVKVTSRNAGALNRDDPYLDVLTDYLAKDTTIKSKLEKLEREAQYFNATRLHLFIGLASTGVRGGLLPASPSYFTWGTFVAPAPLTDLWLEGGTGELYHWTQEFGWVFHNMQR
jgi:hypothetical protein